MREIKIQAVVFEKCLKYSQLYSRRMLRRFYSSAKLNDIIQSKVQSYLQNQCGVSGNSPLLISVSGGCDSMALLHLICDIFKATSSIEVIHFNHMVRDESIQEEKFVRVWAENYGLKMHTFELPPEERGSASFQSRAREWRRKKSRQIYHKMMKSSEKSDGGILLGHHADDQIETSLMKLVRGVHLSHLRPMKPREGCFIRPLLGVHKCELVEFMNSRNLPWCEDSSNQERSYVRNRIRLDAVPTLASVAGGQHALYRRVCEIAEDSDELREWIQAEMDRYQQTCKNAVSVCPLSGDLRLLLSDDFHSLPSMVARELVRSSVVRHLERWSSEEVRESSEEVREKNRELLVRDDGERDSGLSRSQTSAVMALTARGAKFTSLSLSSRWEVARVEEGQLRIRRRRRGGTDKATKKKLRLLKKIEGYEIMLPSEEFQERNIEVEAIVDNSTPSTLHLESEEKATNEKARHFLDTGSVSVSIHNLPAGLSLLVRGRHEGDRFSSPFNKNGTDVKVKDFFREMGIPVYLRNSFPVIERLDSREIVAIPPFVANAYLYNTKCALAPLSISINMQGPGHGRVV